MVLNRHSFNIETYKAKKYEGNNSQSMQFKYDNPYPEIDYSVVPESYEDKISDVYEGANISYNPETITQDMVYTAIDDRIVSSREITESVSKAIYAGINEKVEEYRNNVGMGN